MEKDRFIHLKSPEVLREQMEAVNTIRLRDGREALYANPEDFAMSEEQLKEKYGQEYENFKKDLRHVIKERVEGARSEEELNNTVRELSRPADYYERYSEEAKKEKSLSVKQRIALMTLGSTLAFGGVGALLGLYKEASGRYQHASRVSVGKNNPILAAQSAGRMLFKDDNGAKIEFSFSEKGQREVRSYGSVEQVILDPASFKKEDDIQNFELEKKYNNGEISFEAYKKKHWEIEGRKKQGFLDAYERQIISFEEIAQGIKEAGQRGILTTLNFGDSSTSGWNSEIMTENAITIARLIFLDLHKQDASLPETFDAFVQRNHPGEYNSHMYLQIMSVEAERLKSHPLYQKIIDQHWDEARKTAKSPFMTYDTYSEKMAQLDSEHHYVNFGVPGYSSVHAKAYVKRILDELKQADALHYVNSVTLYFGNNDSVNNGNREDKYYLGDDVRWHFHALGLIHEDYPGVFNATRVSERDYRNNVTSTITFFKEQGIKNITLFVPVVPFDWIPGKRSENDAQEIIEEQYKKGGKASKELDIAHDKHAEYELAVDDVDNPDFEKGREFGQEALEHDYMVPRRKRAYVKELIKVAKEQGVNVVNIEGVLPIRDMSRANTSPKNPENITNDYCHPGEHVNILLAFAQSVITNENIEASKAKALEQLLALQKNTDDPISEDILKQEIEYVVNQALATPKHPEAYDRLSTAQRTRHTWRSALTF